MSISKKQWLSMVLVVQQMALCNFPVGNAYGAPQTTTTSGSEQRQGDHKEVIMTCDDKIWLL